MSYPKLPMILQGRGGGLYKSLYFKKMKGCLPKYSVIDFWISLLLFALILLTK